MTRPPTHFGDLEIVYDDAYDLDLAETVGEAAALARALMRRPSTGDVADPVALGLLQRAHDLEDQAVCRAIGLGLDPEQADRDPLVRGLLAQVRACEQRVIDLADRRAA
jgi:hypothetical protein